MSVSQNCKRMWCNEEIWTTRNRKHRVANQGENNATSTNTSFPVTFVENSGYLFIKQTKRPEKVCRLTSLWTNKRSSCEIEEWCLFSASPFQCNTEVSVALFGRPGSSLSLSKCFRLISGLHAKLFLSEGHFRCHLLLKQSTWLNLQ